MLALIEAPVILVGLGAAAVVAASSHFLSGLANKKEIQESKCPCAAHCKCGKNCQCEKETETPFTNPDSFTGKM